MTHAFDFVSAQVVHQHDVSGPQPRTQSLAYEAQDDISVDCSAVRRQLGLAAQADGAYRGRVVHRPPGRLPMASGTERLVQEDESTGAHHGVSSAAGIRRRQKLGGESRLATTRDFVCVRSPSGASLAAGRANW